MVEAGGAPLTAGAVLLHTVPHSAADVDTEEAVWRQYNSCVDFSFQEGRGNAREFLRTGNSNPERERAGMTVLLASPSGDLGLVPRRHWKDDDG